ncbi:hypothetical protein M885DRAFT_442974 [Pelagophyceae sp. CCMP2097]|nr:hypothetical protein M885DRAFT_442974 [Pelagophyceae sp. CCMP2097]
MLYDEEVDLQKEATDDALSGVPGDWVEEKYTEAQQLAAPRGAVFETRLAASKVLRSLGNSRFSAGEHAEALFAYERAFWQVDFDLAFLKIEMTEAHQKATYEAQTPVRLNMAQCLLKTGGARVVLMMF